MKEGYLKIFVYKIVGMVSKLSMYQSIVRPLFDMVLLSCLLKFENVIVTYRKR